MTTTFRSTALAAMLAFLPAAASGQAAALEKGSFVLGGSAGFNIEDNGVGDNAFTISAIPRVEYFLADGFAVGGHLGASRYSQGESSSTSVHAGPTVSYYFLQDGRVHPFVQALASYTRSTFSSPVSDGSRASMGLTGAVGLLYMLSDAVGVDTRLFVRRDSHENFTGDTIETTRGGLLIGFSAFVF